MGNKTFLHYLKCLAIAAVVLVAPHYVRAQEYTDLVGSSLDGWHLLWGSFDASSGQYDWTRCGNSATGGSGADGQEQSGGAYLPDVDKWKENYKSNSAWPNKTGGGWDVCAPRFYINGVSGSNRLYDPLYHPDNLGKNDKSKAFFTVPEGYNNSMRIGSISSTENQKCFGAEYSNQCNTYNTYNNSPLYTSTGHYKYFASAEGAYYDLPVTEDNCLLTLQYVFVTANPNCDDDHSGTEADRNADRFGAGPSYDMFVLYPTKNGDVDSYPLSNRVECGNDALSSCTMGDNPSSYNQVTGGLFNRKMLHTDGNKWRTSSYNLREYIGKTIRIMFRTHDCVYNKSGLNTAGGHLCYLYFTARTSPAKLDIKYCKASDPVSIKAPGGFDSYTWFGKKGVGGTFTRITKYDNADEIYENSIGAISYDQIKCDMKLKNPQYGIAAGQPEYLACKFELEANLAATDLEAKIIPTWECQRYVTITENSYVNPRCSDKVVGRTWTYLNKSYGPDDLEAVKAIDYNVPDDSKFEESTDTAKSVSHQFDITGQWVKLKVKTKAGCEDVRYFFIKPNPEPVWGVQPEPFCDGYDASALFTTDAAYNALSQTAPESAEHQQFYWNEYNNLSADLRFYVTLKDEAQTVVTGYSDVDILLGLADFSDTHYSYVAEDKWHCKVEGDYNLTVKRGPEMNFVKLPDDRDKNIFYVCNGEKASIQMKSSTAEFYKWNNDNDKVASSTQGTQKFSTSKDCPFGSYNITGYVLLPGTTNTYCTTTAYFNVDYHADSVDLVIPTPVCPYEEAVINCVNADITKGVPTWWELKKGSTTKTLTYTGTQYAIPFPDREAVYYCDATDRYGCVYHKNFKLTVTPEVTSTIGFSVNGISKTANNPRTHYYTLPNVCVADNISAKLFNPSSKTTYSYSTDRGMTWTQSVDKVQGGHTISGFSVESGENLMVIFKTEPFDARNNALCISYDTLVVGAEPTITANTYFNGSAPTGDVYACVNSNYTIKVEPFWDNSLTSTPADFTIQWTDGHFDYTETTDPAVQPWSVTVKARDEIAKHDEKGDYYLHTYTITSRAAGCVYKGNVKVYILPVPEFTVVMQPEDVCAGSNATIIGTDKNAGDLMADFASKEVVDWYFPTNDFTAYTGLSNANGHSKTYARVVPGEYTIEAATKYGCRSSQVLTVKTAEPPVLNVILRPESGSDITFVKKVDPVSTKEYYESETAVCANSRYRMLVEDGGTGYSYTCTQEPVAGLRRTSSPYETVSWNGEQVSSGTLLEGEYNYAGNSSLNSATLFPFMTAQKVSGTEPLYDTYDISISTPCGCKATLPYKVKVKAAPTVALTSAKNFICSNDNVGLELTATTSATGDDVAFYWFTEKRAPGDLNNQPAATNKTADASGSSSKFTATYDMTNHVTYQVQVTDGQCFGTAEKLIYNQIAPVFSLATDPSTLCLNGANSEVKVMANSTKSPDVVYYLKQNSNTYSSNPNYADENGSAEMTVTTKTYMMPDGSFVVKGGNALRYGETTTWTTSTDYFCFTEMTAGLKNTNLPVVNVELYKVGGVAPVTDWTLCPNTQYLFKVNNSNPNVGSNLRYKISIRDLNDPTREVLTETVSNGNVATITNTLFVTDPDEAYHNYEFKIAPIDNSTCEGVVEKSIKISPVPQVRLTDDGTARWLGDTLRYCVDFHGRRSANANNIVGVTSHYPTITATIDNFDESNSYTYTWYRNGNVMNQTIDGTTYSNSDHIKAGVIAANGDYSNKGTYTHDATYQVRVTDGSGCAATSKVINVRAVDSPRPWRDIWNVCMNSNAIYRVWEDEKNVRIKNTALPRYVYKAYNYDASADEHLGEEVYSWSDWVVNNRDNIGKLKNSKNQIVDDSVTLYKIYKQVSLPVGTETNENPKKYVITKTDSLGCTAFEEIWYTPIEYPNPDKVHVGLSVFNSDDATNIVNKQVTIQTGADGTMTTGDYFDLGAVSKYKTDTIAYVCPGEKLIFYVADETDYNPSYDNSFHPISRGKNFYVWVNFINVTEPGFGWFTSRGNWSNKATCNTQRALTNSQAFRIGIANNGTSNFSNCRKNSEVFYVAIDSAPTLTFFGDHACRYDEKGTPYGVVKFRAASSLTDRDAHMEYAWYDATNVNPEKSLGVEDEYSKDTLWVQHHFTDTDFGTAGYKDVTRYLHGQAVAPSRTYCRSADKAFTRRIYNNPDFSITPDKNVVCYGDSITFKVTQNYNIDRNYWEYFSNDSVFATKHIEMYNSNEVSRGQSYEKTNTEGFPHYYLVKRPITKDNDTFYVTAYIHGTDLNWTNTYSTNSINSTLYCYTTKNVVTHALRKPNAKLQLFARNETGKYKAEDIVMSVSSAAVDSTGNRKICPGAEYYRMFTNLTPDELTNYNQSSTTYYIKNITKNTEPQSFTLGSKTPYQEQNSYEANSDYFSFWAETSNGCLSDTLQFQLPLSQTPYVTISATNNGEMCAGDPSKQVTLTANARYGNPFTYEWYTNSVTSSNSLTKNLRSNDADNPFVVDPNDPNDVSTNRVSLSKADFLNFKVKPYANGTVSEGVSLVRYAVQVTNVDGCVHDTFTDVKIYPQPLAIADKSADNICKSNPFKMVLSKSLAESYYKTQPFTYIWDDANKAKIGSSADPFYTNDIKVKGEDTTFYFIVNVDATPTLTCTNRFSQTVSTVGIPSTIPILSSSFGRSLNSGDKLCPGETFTVIFSKLGAVSNSCPTLTYHLINATTNVEQQQTVAANEDARFDAIELDKNVVYNYYVESSCNCKSPVKTFNLGLAQKPVIEVVGKRTFCQNTTENLTLSANAGAVEMKEEKWMWTPTPPKAAGASESEQADPHKAVQKFLPSTSQTYTVTGTSADGCDADPIQVDVEMLPSALLVIEPESQVACEGTKVSLKATNMNPDVDVKSIDWTSTSGNPFRGEEINPVINQTETFSAVATTTNNCTSPIATATVTMAPKPVAHAVFKKEGSTVALAKDAKLCPRTIYYPVFENKKANGTLCTIDEFQIWANNSTDTFKVQEAAGIDANTSAQVSFVMGETAQSYRYRVVSGCGCVSADSVISVGIAPIPTVSITGVNKFCSNTKADIQLTASSTFNISTYEWTGEIAALTGEHKEIANVKPVITTTYTVIGKTADGCESRPFSYEVRALDTAYIVLDEPTNICNGSDALVTANLSMPTGAQLQSSNWTIWHEGDDPENEKLPYNFVDGNRAKVKFALTEPTNYRGEFKLSNGCTSISEIKKITPLELPDPTVELVYFDGDHKGDIITGPVCPGTRFFPRFKNENLNSCDADTFFVTDKMMPAEDKFISASGNQTNDGAFVYEVTGNKTYYYRAETSCGCKSKGNPSFSVSVAKIPSITIKADGLKGNKGNKYCNGDKDYVTLTANSTMENTFFSWADPIPSSTISTPSVSVLPSDVTYTVFGTTAIEDGGCTVSADFTMEALPKPNAQIDAPEQVCAGSTFQLTASSDDEIAGYVWNTKANTATINANISETSTFTVQTYTKDGCYSDEVDHIVRAVDKPKIKFSYNDKAEPNYVCAGQPIKVEATVDNNNATFTWYSDANRTNELTVANTIESIDRGVVTVRPLTSSSTVLYVTATLDGCSNDDNTQVKAYALPNFYVDGKTTLCAGQDLKLTIGNLASYIVEDPIDHSKKQTTSFFWESSADSSNKYSEPSMEAGTRVIKVMATDEHLCSSTQTVNVTVNPSPKISVDQAVIDVCPNDRATVTASGADTYTWNVKGDNSVILGRNEEFTSEALTEKVVYRVVGTKTNTQCVDSSFVTINVKTAPTLELITDTTDKGIVNVCDGDTAVLQVRGAMTYEWTSDVYKSDGSKATIIPTYSRIYRVKGILDGCSAIRDINVDVLSKPVVSLTAVEGVCEGSDVTLKAKVNNSTTVNPNMEYTWSDDPTDKDLEHVTAVTADQTFIFSVLDKTSGCEGQAQRTVKAYPLPFVDIQSDLNTVCEDSVVILTPHITSGTPDFRYKWSRKGNAQTYSSAVIRPNVFTRTFKDENNEDVIVKADTFMLVVTDANKCQSSMVEKPVFIQTPPTIRNIAPTIFCQTESENFVRLNMQNATEYRYMNSEWTATKDTVIYRSIPGSFTIRVTGRVPLEGATNRYCQTKAIDIDETIAPAPKLEMFIKDVQTEGVCSGSPVTLQVNSSVKDDVTYEWEGVTGNNKNTYTETALYENRDFVVTVTDNTSGCSAKASQYVEVYEIPQVKFTLVPSPACSGVSTTMTAKATSSNTDVFTYVWRRYSDPTWKPTTASVPVTSTALDTFYVSATDATHNCSSKEIKTVLEVQELPVVTNSADLTYCAGDSVRLNLHGAAEYYVDNVLIAGSDTAMLLPVGTSFYQIYGRSPRLNAKESYSTKYCVSKTITVEENVVSAPTVTIEGNNNLCQGQSVDLVAKVTNYSAADAMNLTYSWSESDTATHNVLKRPLNGPRTITVTVKDPNTACVGKDEKQFNVWSNPTVNIVLPDGDIVCDGDAISLNSEVSPAGDSYQYFWKNSQGKEFSFNNISPIVRKVGQSNKETFYLYVKDPHDCVSETAEQVINIVDKPEIGIDYPATMCKDGDLKMVLSGATKYWVNNVELVDNDGVNVSTYTEHMTSAHTAFYSIVGANILPSGAECYSEFGQPISIEVKDNPTLVIKGNTTICDGSPLKLTVSGADSYQWNTTDNNSDDYIFELTPSGSVEGEYTYDVIGTFNAEKGGCSSKETVVVHTLKAPSFYIEPSAKGVCLDSPVDLKVVPNAGSVNTDRWSYVWQGGQLTGTTGPNVSPIVTRGADASSHNNKFSVTATNEVGCAATQSIEISLFDLPKLVVYASNDIDDYASTTKVDPTAQIKLCENVQLKLLAQPDENSAGITSYEWDNNPDETAQVYFPEDNVPNRLTYHHTVVGTTANGCKASTDVNVIIAKAPNVEIITNPTACQTDDRVTNYITLKGQGADKYVWPDFPSNEFPNGAEGVEMKVSAEKLGTNTFTLYGYKNGEECRGKAVFNVEVFENPAFDVDNSGAYVCAGDKATLTVNPYNVNADYKYSWTGNLTTQTIYPSSNKAGTLNMKVTVTDRNNGCAVTNTVPVTFFEIPSLKLVDGTNLTVCRGSELELIAEGANEYYWTVGADSYGPYVNEDKFTTTPIVSQTYRLYGNNVNINPITAEDVVCTASKDFNVSVVNSPSIIISGKSVLCYGEDVKLTASGIDLTEAGAGYVWNENPSKNTAVFEDQFTSDNGAEVTYTVVGTAGNGCKSTKTATVTMRPKTIVRLKAPSPVCEGDVAYAVASSDAKIKSYRWDTDEVSDSIAHVINGDTKYTVVATDENDCKVSESATITIQPKLVLTDETENRYNKNADGAWEICAGHNISLRVGGASEYMWNNNPEKNQAFITLAPLTDTIYTVQGKYGVCKASLSIPVHALAAPTILIQGDRSVCSGESLTLKPYSDVEDLEYVWGSTSEITNREDDNITIAPIVDSKVTLTGTTKVAKGTGCSTTVTEVIKVNNLPELKIDGDLQPCANTYTDLVASGAMSYQWTINDVKVNSPAYSPLIGTEKVNVKLWGIDANNCSNSIETEIEPLARPEFKVEGNTVVCLNTSLQLEAINDQTSCIYVWEGKDTVNIFNKKMTKSGTQTIPVTAILSNKPGCSTTKRITINVNDLPSLYLTGNTIPCQNSQLKVAAHGAEKFIWSDAPEDTCYVKNAAGEDVVCEYTRDVTSPSSFSVQLSGWKNGCRKDSVFTFSVHPSPLVTIAADMDETCVDGVVTLTATSPDATTFDWGRDGAGATITPVITADKKFTVTVFDQYGCKGTESHEIKVISSPKISIFVSEENNAAEEITDGNYAVCNGNALTFIGRGAKTWSWVDGLQSSSEESYSIEEATTTHRIKVTGYLGNCEASEEIRVEVRQKPDVWIDGFTNVCEGDDVKLLASSSNDDNIDHYEWFGVTKEITGDKNENLTYQLLYQPVEGVLTGVGTNGCKSNVPFTLTFTKAPELNVASVSDVCVGAPTELSVVNPEDDVVYVWNDNFSGETFTYRSTTAGLDEVKVEAKVRGLGGCTTVKTYSINTHDLPVITFSADGDNVKVGADSTITLCAGSDLILVPLGAKHYTWTSEGMDTTVNTMVLKPTSNSVYSIMGIDEYGCKNTRDIFVKTEAAPVLYSTTYGVPDENGRINVAVCRNQSIVLDIAGADSYSWFDGSVQKRVEVTPTDSRIYTVEGIKSSNNCPASVDYFVTVNELPEVLITDNDGNTGRASLCRDTKFTLKATGAKTYVWSDMNNSVLSRKDSLVDYAGESDYYTVVATDSNKCVNTANFTIRAIEVPTISYEPADPSVCAGARTTLYGRSTEANSWYWMLDGDTVSTKSSLNIIPTADANYTLYGRNKYGCETSVDVPLTVFSSPTIWIDGYSTTNGVSDTIKVCKYQDFKLTVMGDADSYEWPSGSTENSITVENASMSQNYQVTGIGGNNCRTTIVVPVKVIPTALITVKGDQYVCYGSTTTLNAVADASDYDNYVWSNNMIGTENQVYVFSDTTFTVTGYNSNTGCSNTVSFPIKKKDLPVLGYQGETNICKGASSVIYATGANSYVWHDGTQSDAYVSTPNTNSIYKVVGTLDGCSDSISIPITVQVAPVIWAEGLKPICKGERLQLVAQGADRYEWSDGTTTAEFTALPIDNVTYTLTGTYENGCSTTIQVPVTVRELPVVTIDGSTNVCLNSTTELEAVISSTSTVDDGAGNKYRWFHNDEVISTQNVLNYLITEEKTSFVLEGIDPAGCANTAKFTITSMPLPKVSYTGPDAICTGSAGTFYATGAKEYKWINAGDTVVGNVFKASPVTDSYYTLVGTSAMGCKADTNIFLVVNQLPEVSVSGNTNVCRGEALDLMGAGAKTYLWSNGSTDEHFTSVPVATSEYTLTGTDENGCSNTAKFKVVVNELPTFLVRSTSEGVCEGLMDTLYADNSDKEGSYTYFWNAEDGTNLSGDSISPVIAKTTVFKVTANNDETHCQSSVNKTIYAYMKPVIGFLGKDSVCSGGSITITAVGADSYEWENNGEIVSTKPTFTISDAKTATELYVTGKLATCSATEVFSVKVVPTPNPTIAEVDGKDYACRGSEVELLGSCFVEKGVYKWAVNGDTVKSDTSIYTSLTDLPKRTTSYSLTAINSFGCRATTTKVISIQELPTVGISVDKRYVCPNQVDSVKFTAKKTGKKNLDWMWQSRPGQDEIYSNAVESSFTAIIDTTVMVYLYGTDDLGCVGVDSTLISLRPSTNMKFRVNPSCIDNDSRKVRFTGLVPEAEATKWTWTVDMSKGDTVMGSIANYEYLGVLPDSIEVGVHAVDPYGCMFDSTAYIYKWHDFWAPEAFSPNGDGLNDRFIFRGGRFIDEFHVVIYDRLGAIVYEGDESDLIHSAADDIPTDKGWDGTCKGKACPWGVYGYTVTYKSNENAVSKSGKKRGMITLIR